MKKLLLIFIVCCSLNGFGQNEISNHYDEANLYLDSLGLDSSLTLNVYESDFLNRYRNNSYKLNQNQNIDFSEKKVIFVYSDEAEILNKSEYFQKYVIPQRKNNGDVPTRIFLLSKKESEKCQNIYAIVVIWADFLLTKKDRKRILKEYFEK